MTDNMSLIIDYNAKETYKGESKVNQQTIL